MSFPFVLLPGKVRLLMEMEDERASRYWLDAQADFLEAGAKKEDFDAFALASEELWCSVAKSIREGRSGDRASFTVERAGELLSASGLSATAKEKLFRDVASTIVELEDILLRVGPEYQCADYLSELALVHAMRAGLTRYFQCAHFSSVRPSARVAMLLDPAVNLSGSLDLEASPTAVLALMPRSLAVPAEDLSRAFAPVQLSAVTPRTFTVKEEKPQSDARRMSRFRRMSFAQLWARMLLDRPHLSSLPTGEVTAGVTWSPAYRRAFAGFVKLLTKHFGDRPVASLEEADWISFFAMLDRLPKLHHKSTFEADRTLDEIIAAAEREVAGGKLDPARIGLGSTSINLKVSHCRTLWKFLAERVGMPVIHWSQFERRKPKPSRDRGYSLEEMKQFFELPMYWGRSKASGPLMVGDTVWHNAAYWVMLFAAYSGARVGEICGLRVVDVKMMGSIWYVELRDSSLRTLKRRASVRDLPVHPELIRLGFLDFVSAMKEAGERHLFREIHSEGRSLACGFRELVGKYIKRLLPFIDGGELCHPVRHYVSEQLRLAEVPRATREAIIGHRGEEDLAERHTSVAHLQRALDAITTLPNLTSAVQAHPILLHPERLRTRRKRPDIARARKDGAAQYTFRFGGDQA